jgi:hypothetical protein
VLFDVLLKMRTLILFHLLLCWIPFAAAEEDFQFHVYDEIKTNKLHYRHGQRFSLFYFDSQLPRIVFSTEHWVRGINQREFTYTEEYIAKDLGREEFKAILENARLLPIVGLDPRNIDNPTTHGWLKIDGRNQSITAGPESDIRKKWDVFLTKVFAQFAPKEERSLVTRQLEGDLIKPTPVDFKMLLGEPKKFDGKRIRISGYYHSEFEMSNFAPSERLLHSDTKAVWLDGSSTFADEEKIKELNDTFITVEGTFELARSGHGGLYFASLNRPTLIERADPPKAEQDGTGQPATRTESDSEGDDNPQTEAEGRSR